MQFFLDSEHVELRCILGMYQGKNVMDILKVNGSKKLNKMYMTHSLKNQGLIIFSSLHYRFYNPFNILKIGTLAQRFSDFQVKQIIR